MRKLGIGLIIFIVLIVVALLVVPSFINVNTYHSRIQSELQQKLGRQVSFGTMHLKLLPPKLRVDNLMIADDPRFSTTAPFAQAGELDVAVKLMPLLHKEVQVSSLELIKPHIEMIRNAQGVWNFSTIGQNPAAPMARPGTSQTPAPSNLPPSTSAPQSSAQQTSQQNFQLDSLQITDGQVAITDAQKHQSRAVYDHIDVALKNFAPGKPFSITATAHLPGSGNQVVNLDGNGGPINSANMANTPFQGTVKLDQVSLSAAQKFLNSPALVGTDANISGSMKINNQTGILASDGSIKLQNTRLRGVDVGYPITVDYSIGDNLNTDVLQIKQGSLRLGSTPISITGTIDTKPTPAQLDAQLKASDVSIGEVARLAAAMGVAFSPGTDIAGRLTADIHARGATSQPALNGSLSAKNLSISGKGLPQPVKVDGITLALTPNDIRSNPFTAVTGGTSLAVQFALSRYTTPSPVVDATLRTANAQVGELLNMAQAYGVSGLDGVTGSGNINIDVHAVGPVKNASAMNFSGTGRLQNAVVKAPSLTQPLNVRNANMQFTQNSVVLQNLTAGIGQTNASGNVTLKNFSAPQVQFNLTADKVNVVELQNITSPAPAQQNRKASLDSILVPSAHAAGKAQPSLLNTMTGSGTVNIGTILYDQLVLNNARSNVTMDRGLIRLAPLTAQLYGGQETGSVVLDTRQTPIAINVTSKLNSVDANKLISSVSPLKQTLYGLLAANSQLGFSATNSNDIARTLNGKLSLDLSKGRLMGIDLLHELANIGKFLQGGQQAKSFTNLARLTGNFNIKNGLAQTNDLQAVIDGGTLGATGAVNLAEQSMNMHLTAVLSQAFSKQVGGTSVGGFMNTALANNRGELVIPVIVTGTFQHPSFAPDVEKIAQMRLQNMVPNSQNPGGMVSGMVGQIFGQKNKGQQQPAAGAQPATQTQPAQSDNPLGDVLNQVLGGKKKNQQQQQPPPSPPQ